LNIAQKETLRVAGRINKLIQRVGEQREQLRVLTPKTQKEFSTIWLRITGVQKKLREANDGLGALT
jgi:hypothetical protein